MLLCKGIAIKERLSTQVTAPGYNGKEVGQRTELSKQEPEARDELLSEDYNHGCLLLAMKESIDEIIEKNRRGKADSDLSWKLSTKKLHSTS